MPSAQNDIQSWTFKALMAKLGVWQFHEDAQNDTQTMYEECQNDESKAIALLFAAGCLFQRRCAVSSDISTSGALQVEACWIPSI